ncbi:MAG TPA: SHOCT domain-containing protein [Nocardioides sp.]|nr:SHOCT domain-containing protein [Nocardioides sp.]
MTSAWDYEVWEGFWTLLWFFLFFIWIWLLISVFSDIFRSDDLSGWNKAFWTIFVVVLPYLGVFVYLIARGKKMGEHAVRDASRREEQMRSYVQEVAGSGTSTAQEIERLHQLQTQGAITEEEFRQAKAKLLT